MEELDDGARVWRVFNDESERIDAELVGGWTSTLDTLFIFAGLFSAVVATFLIQIAQSLQQDYSAVTASLLTEMVKLQRATAIGGNISEIPQSDLTYDSTFTSSSRDVWLNSLWLTSLALTLSVALMAGLIKQWLHYYLADITGATPKVRACTRQFRYRGLIQWGVPAIIESLPVLMNSSLFLFFVGLVLFTQDLSDTVGISWFLVGLTFILFTMYVGSSFIPIWKPQCPYKTSLSKLYSGIIDIVWYFVEWQSIEDEEQETIASSSVMEDGRSHVQHYFVYIKKWITELLIYGSSLRKAESETVVNQGFMLQQDVITEMGLNSTNPSVSAIALQSLAAFQIHQVSIGLPDSLIEKLVDLFRGCFQRDSSKEWGYSITSNFSVAERYSRAMILFPDYISHGDDDWERLLYFSPPKTFRTAILLASAVRHAIKYRSLRMNENLKLVIQFILDAPSIEVSKLIPWQHRQFIEAIELSDLYSADEQEQLLFVLVKRLSPNNALTLQEDLLIRCLYSCCTKAGLIKPLMEQALIKKLSMEASIDVRRRSQATLLRLIILLPDIADWALSVGSEEQDCLLLYLSRIYFDGWTGGIDIIWDKDLVEFFNYKPGFSPCVNSLIKLLNRLASSWEEWNGDVLNWLRAITNLYDALCFHGKCNDEVISAILHWLLVISLEGRDCPGNVNPDDRAGLENNLLESLLPSPHQNSSLNVPKNHIIHSLRVCCAFITTKQLVGLPSVVMEQLFRQFEYLQKESCELEVLGWMDTLFCHFIEQDPLIVDQAYPMTQACQHQTLTSLINFAHDQQSHSPHWEEMLSSWQVLVINKNLKISVDEKTNVTGKGISGINLDTMHADNSEPSIDPWDLCDVLWIFEVNHSIDPLDLQDVLWMFEAQIPFGGPLNLERLLQHFNRVLGQQEGSIDL